MRLELLESRRMLAVDTIHTFTVIDTLPTHATMQITEGPGNFAGTSTISKTGTLLVQGTSDDDTLAILQDGNKIKYETTLNGHHAFVVVSASAVKRIYVNAGGGDDKIFLDPALQKRATVIGGSGNDHLEGAYGSTLIGGSGNDHLEGAYGSTLIGGSGNDHLEGAYGSTLIGGSGNDHLTLPPDGVIVADSKTPSSGVWLSTNIGPGQAIGGDGDDFISAGSVNAIVGGKGDDILSESIHFNTRPTPLAQYNAKDDFGARASGVESFMSVLHFEDTGDVVQSLILKGTAGHT